VCKPLTSHTRPRTLQEADPRAGTRGGVRRVTDTSRALDLRRDLNLKSRGGREAPSLYSHLSELPLSPSVHLPPCVSSVFVTRSHAERKDTRLEGSSGYHPITCYDSHGNGDSFHQEKLPMEPHNISNCFLFVKNLHRELSRARRLPLAEEGPILGLG
jgi:hypothetical protein